MNYGTPKDWRKYKGRIPCAECQNTATWDTTDEAEGELDGDYLCNDCYQKLVVTPNLKPLTIEDMAADLIGKEVVCIDNLAGIYEMTEGASYNVESIFTMEYVSVKDDMDTLVLCRYNNFAFPVEVPAPQIQERCVTAPVPTQPEITYSCELEFPNGETVTIPEPEGPGWAAETTRYDWPHMYMVENELRSIWKDGTAVNHTNGRIIYDEYYRRAITENARIISATTWTRDPNYQPPERKETFEELARRRYPSRMRG